MKFIFEKNIRENDWEYSDFQYHLHLPILMHENSLMYTHFIDDKSNLLSIHCVQEGSKHTCTTVYTIPIPENVDPQSVAVQRPFGSHAIQVSIKHRHWKSWIALTTELCRACIQGNIATSCLIWRQLTELCATPKLIRAILTDTELCNDLVNTIMDKVQTGTLLKRAVIYVLYHLKSSLSVYDHKIYSLLLSTGELKKDDVLQMLRMGYWMSREKYEEVKMMKGDAYCKIATGRDNEHIYVDAFVMGYFAIEESEIVREYEKNRLFVTDHFIPLLT